MKYPIGFMFTFLLLIGCGGYSTHFVVYRHVPENPSFVVIPANDSMQEIAFANNIEHILIGCHVSVLQSPAIKAVEKERAARETENEAGNQSKHKAAVTEWFFEFEEINADYIVQAYEMSYMVKISKRETREIVAVLKIPNLQYEAVLSAAPPSPQEFIFEALVNLEIVPPPKKE